MSDNVKEMLTEVYRTTKKISGVDPSKPGNMKGVLVDDAAFDAYPLALTPSALSSASVAFMFSS